MKTNIIDSDRRFIYDLDLHVRDYNINCLIFGPAWSDCEREGRTTPRDFRFVDYCTGERLLINVTLGMLTIIYSIICRIT